MLRFEDYADHDLHVYAELIAYDRVPDVYTLEGQQSMILSHMFGEVYRIALGEPVGVTYSLANDVGLIEDAIAFGEV